MFITCRYYLFGLDIVASLTLTIDASGVRLSASTLSCSPADQDNGLLRSIDMKLQFPNKPLNHGNLPRPITFLQLPLKMLRPVEYASPTLPPPVQSRAHIISISKINALLKNSSSIKQDGSLFLIQIKLISLIIKQINRLNHPKDLSLPNVANYCHIFSQ